MANNENKVNCCKQSGKTEVNKNEFDQKMEKISENKLKTIIKDLLGEFFNPIKKSLEVEMKELTESVQFLSNSFDDHKTKIEKVMKELKQIKRKNMDLKTKLNELERKINNQEQKEKQNNMIIRGVSKKNEMDPKKLLKKSYEQ